MLALPAFTRTRITEPTIALTWEAFHSARRISLEQDKRFPWLMSFDYLIEHCAYRDNYVLFMPED